MTVPIQRPLISGMNSQAAAGAERLGVGPYEPRTVPHQPRKSLIIGVRPFVPFGEAPFHPAVGASWGGKVVWFNGARTVNRLKDAFTLPTGSEGVNPAVSSGRSW